MLTTLRASFLLLLVTFIAGCAATGPKMSEMKSTIPALSPDQGRIYFYRTTSMLGAAVSADLRLNGDVVGRSQRGAFFYVDRPAGNYEVASSTETEKKLSFALDAGETKYVRTYVGVGVVVGRIVPELVNADEASKEMDNLAYVQSIKM
jgi:hypothetical protein